MKSWVVLGTCYIEKDFLLPCAEGSVRRQEICQLCGPDYGLGLGYLWGPRERGCLCIHCPHHPRAL